MGRGRYWLTALAVVLMQVIWMTALAQAVSARPIRPDDISVPDGYTIEAFAEGLAAPTMATFDEEGRMLVAESGYDGGGSAKVTRIEKDGKRTVLVSGDAFGDAIPVTSVGAYKGQVYVVHAGTVSVIENGRLRDIISGLPGSGDHQADTILFKDDSLYISIGTVTNSAVVGPDNAVFGWLKQEKNRKLHDVPCKDVQIAADAVFDSENPFERGKSAKTSPYAAFDDTSTAGTTVPGDVKCNGAVLKAKLDGSGLQLVAWGFRNPYGMAWGADGALYVSMHGFDARGSRPIENAPDCLYRIEEGAWYGFPDYACDVPVTDARFAVKDKPRPAFVLKSHPNDQPPKPLAKFSPHAAANGFAFAPSRDWGGPDQAFVALFGDFTPATGTVDRPEGVKVVKVDTTTNTVTDFIVNKEAGQASRHSAGGIEHPSSVVFGPDGAMYVTDWGVARISTEGLKLEADTGVVWKVTRGQRGGLASLPIGPSLLYALVGVVVFGAGTFALARGRAGPLTVTSGVLGGAVAGLFLGVVTMLVAPLVLRLPWYAPPRVLATLVMGRGALSNILEFELVSFIVGVVVLLVLTIILGIVFALLLRTREALRAVGAGLFFGLAVWAVLQYFAFPLIDPLITEKGFPPEWYAIGFALFGIALGAVALLLNGGRLGDWTPVQRARRT